MIHSGNLDMMNYLYPCLLEIFNFNQNHFIEFSLYNRLDMIKHIHYKYRKIVEQISKKKYINILIKIAKNKYFEMLKYLININPDIDITFINIELFLNVAKNGHINVLKYLYEINPNLNVKDIEPEDIIVIIKNLHFDILKFILDIYPDIEYGHLIDENVILCMLQENDHTLDEELMNKKLFNILMILSKIEPIICIEIRSKDNYKLIKRGLELDELLLLEKNGFFVFENNLLEII